ncbi:MAG: hypothetical protein IPN69_08555 [Acidobacteria bacterium]|nr:hypothetical protein [Acidobacteriota bacterium]
MKIDYTATDGQLIEAGLSPRIIELAKQPFMRPGGIDFDIPYAMAVLDAREKADLYALHINNPGKNVYFPPIPGKATMGLVVDQPTRGEV